MDMFGVLITGRLVQTDFRMIADDKIVINIPDADDVKHIVVFMTGQTAFPEGMGGAVYFSWPCEQGPSWHLLGYLSNSKPSAIYKVGHLKQDPMHDLHPFGRIEDHQSHMMQIGISVETIDTLVQQTPALNTQVQSVDSFQQFCMRMLDNCFNFIASFGVNQSQMSVTPGETFVPLSALKQWYVSFQRRFEQNPNFWKS